ncbi:MAG: hypothetical protein ACI9MR_002157 [Myxococcota bacterium]|jgi:hypothetical protein
MPGDPSAEIEAERLAARAAIERAFATVTRGKRGMTIYDAELADDYGLESERSSRIRHLDYQRWQDIDGAVLDDFAVHSFFDPAGLHFHMPAYMVWTLDNYLTSGSLSTDWTIYALDPGAVDSQNYAWQLGRFAPFDPAQRKAVAGFLWFVGNHCEEWLDATVAWQALERYWAEAL